MGYTHYFPQQRALNDKEWSVIKEDTRKIIDHCETNHGIKVQLEYDEAEAPQIDDTAIHFNGVGGDGHETFRITKALDSSFNFCKTANKPYDLVVGLVLLAVEEIAPDALRISSDGEWTEEWDIIRKHFHILFDEIPRQPKELT